MKIRLEYEDGRVNATNLETNDQLIEEVLSPSFKKYYTGIRNVYKRHMERISRASPDRVIVGGLEIEIKTEAKK
ncbi:hypothetical protein HYT25_02150 [Candidatus Pacearchaeota archaeon]|nr:hypothetical protein [Candidatus Pacearchaeota archaeon]